jgi:hypothetical protein
VLVLFLSSDAPFSASEVDQRCCNMNLRLGCWRARVLLD